MSQEIQSKINKIANETEFEGITHEEVADVLTMINLDKVGNQEFKNSIDSVKNEVSQNLQGYLKIADPKPTVAGKYELVGVGTFANLIPNIKPGETAATNTPITTKDGFYNSVYWDGTNFIQNRIEMPKVSKLSDLNPITNILGNVIIGSYWYSNGNIDIANTTKRTEKIPVTPGEKLFFKNKYPEYYINTKNIFFAQEMIISTFPPSNGEWATITVPPGANFVALSCAVEEEFALERREPTAQQIQRSIDVTSKLESLLDGGFITGDLDIEKQGGFYVNNSGALIAHAAFEIGSAKVGSGVKIKVTMAKANFDAFRMLAFFKEDGSFIVGYNDLTLWTDKEFTTPEGTAKLVMTKQVGFTPDYKVTQIGKLENIGDNSDDVKQDNIANDYYEFGQAFQATKDLSGYGLIFAGQSNAVGFTPYNQLAAVGLSNSLNIENYDGTSVKSTLTIPNGSNWGVWFSVLKRMLDAGKTPFYFNYSLGATSLHTQWKVLLNDLSKNFANNLLSLKTLKPNLKQKVVVWIQGENDAISPNDTFYYEDLKALIAYTRGILNNPFLKWVIVGMHKNQQYYSPVVRYAQTQLADEDDNVYFINPDNLTWSHVGDNTHYSGAYNEALAPLIFNLIKDF